MASSGEGGDLRAGTRRGGHRHKADVRPGPQLLAELQHGLGAVHGRAAAEGHHRLGAELRQRPGPLGHQLQGRVGHHLVEHLHGAVPQAGAYPLQQAGLGQEGVGNHHHPPPGQPLQGRQGVRSKENCGLELKSFHRASPVSSLMGLVWQTRRKLYGSLFFAFLHKKFTGFSSDLTFTTGVLRYIIDLKNI